MFFAKSSLDQPDSTENILRVFFFFWKFLILKALKNFLGKLKTCSGYVKQSPRSGEHSALWIRAGRRLKHFIFSKVLTLPPLPHGLDATSLHTPKVLNCHLVQKNFFFVKTQNRQKLSKNDEKTFHRSAKRHIFRNWSNYDHTMNIFWKKNEKNHFGYFNFYLSW